MRIKNRWLLPPCGAVCRGGALLRPKPLCFLSIVSYRGKDPRKPKRFSWSVQGSLRGNRNPLRLFFFCQRFLLEKQKKMLCRSRKFAAVHQPFERLPSSSATAVIFTLAPLSQPPADSSPCRKGSRAAAVSYVFLKIYTLLINSAEDVL